MVQVQKVPGDPKALLKMAESRAIILGTEMSMLYGEREKTPVHEMHAKLRNVAHTIQLILDKEKLGTLEKSDKLSEEQAGKGLKVWMPEVERHLKLIGRGHEDRRRYRLLALYDCLDVFRHL